MTDTTSLASIVDSWDGQSRLTLHAALVAREDNMADMLRLAGQQFGAAPFAVAEVIAQVGLGTTPSEEERALIRASFIAGMEDLRRQYDVGN